MCFIQTKASNVPNIASARDDVNQAGILEDVFQPLRRRCSVRDDQLGLVGGKTRNGARMSEIFLSGSYNAYALLH